MTIAGYLLDTGKFPTDVNQLTIEYSGDEVVCSTTQLNDDSSVYLTGCTVKGRTVDHAYGTDKSLSYEAYVVGDEVTYNGVEYYVLKDSGEKNNIVTLLKATPLTTAEVNQYGGVGTEDNIVNMYVPSTELFYQTAYNLSGYGGMAYYESENCYYKGQGLFETSGCTTDYNNSAVKKVVDSWANDNTNKINLKQARLIKYEEEISNDDIIEYEEQTPTAPNIKYKFKYDFYGVSHYWTMTDYLDYQERVWVINDNSISSYPVAGSGYVVRPVVELYKNDDIVKKTTSTE